MTSLQCLGAVRWQYVVFALALTCNPIFSTAWAQEPKVPETDKESGKMIEEAGVVDTIEADPNAIILPQIVPQNIVPKHVVMRNAHVAMMKTMRIRYWPLARRATEQSLINAHPLTPVVMVTVTRTFATRRG